MFQNWPLLAPAATRAIAAFERQVGGLFSTFELRRGPASLPLHTTCQAAAGLQSTSRLSVPPRLPPPAAPQVELADRPALEERYAAALRRQGPRAASAELAAFTASVAWRAGDLLSELTANAARQLGLPGVPPDDVLQRWLNEAEALYHFKSQG